MTQQPEKFLVHPVWGLPLDVYLAHSRNLPPLLPPHPNKVKESLNLLGTGKASIKTLEICLSLVNNQNEITVFMRDDLLAGCMIGLRHYCDENPLIKHSYGLLCLRVLALIIEVALLECVNPQNLTSVTQNARSHKILTRNVALVVQSWMVPQYDYPLKQKRHLRDLQWFMNSETNQHTCFPKFGGLTASDIEFLLEILVSNSGLFQRLFSRSELRGYCSFLFVIWQKLLRINPTIPQTSKLGNLVFRYWICANKIEHSVLRHIFMWTICRLRDAGTSLRLTSNGENELRAVIKCFIDKTYIPNIPSMEFMATHDVAGLTDFVVDGFKPEVLDMAIPLLEASFSRIWAEIEDGDPPDNEAITRLTASTLMLLSRKFLKNFDWTALLALLLDEVDLIDLLGRVLMLHVDVPEDKVKNNPIILFRKRVTATMRAMYECAPELVAYTFNEKFGDWLKTLRWISSQHPSPGPEAKHNFGLDQNHRKDVWMEIGMALGYDDKLFSCNNPRCAGGDYANLVCERCKGVAYCTLDCQRAHWLASDGDAHWRTCGLTPEHSD
ncbi:unnamed protein product [Rhizoctonia solani]|uniref:MYND-type domain-containing protein n=1 Tax=Rhizoctonia solani TaxID=456999 RepID=A0A8H3BT93_9AGAM|nr:unnamed protein product [Rhizoctonia solani]